MEREGLPGNLPHSFTAMRAAVPAPRLWPVIISFQPLQSSLRFMIIATEWPCACSSDVDAFVSLADLQQ